MSKASFADRIPMHYRESFFRDPFFADCWKILDKSGNTNFSSSEKRTEMSSSSTHSSSSTSRESRESKESAYFEDEQVNSRSQRKSTSSVFDRDTAGSPKMEMPKMNFDSPTSSQSGMSKVINDPDKFQVMVEVEKFTPDELTVKTVDHYVIVEGKHEERKDPHGFISRQFTRKYLLPIDCKPENVSCNLSADGILVVSVPKENIDLLPLKETIIEIAKSDKNVREEATASSSNPTAAA